MLKLEYEENTKSRYHCTICGKKVHERTKATDFQGYAKGFLMFCPSCTKLAGMMLIKFAEEQRKDKIHGWRFA